MHSRGLSNRPAPRSHLAEIAGHDAPKYAPRALLLLLLLQIRERTERLNALDREQFELEKRLELKRSRSA